MIYKTTATLIFCLGASQFQLVITANAEHIDQDDIFCEDDVCTKISSEPIAPACKDTHTACRDWAFEGECDANPRYMLQSCQQSCGRCPGELSAGFEGHDFNCLDSDDGDGFPKLCSELVALGDCMIMKESDTVEGKCRSSCLFCVNEEALREEGISEEEIQRRKIYRSMDLGIPQVNMGRDKVEQHNNQEQMRAMDIYSKRDMTEASITNTMQSKCQNHIKECAYYASKGMCESRTVFMMGTCPLACMMCEGLDDFHSAVGKRHPLETPLFVPGNTFQYIEEAKESGLNTIGSFFDSLIAREDVKAQMVTEPSDGEKSSDSKDEPHMVLVEDFLTSEECDEFLNQSKAQAQEDNWAASSIHKIDHFDGKHSSELPLRSSQTLTCKGSGSLLCTNISTIVNEKLSSLTNLDLEDHLEATEYVRYVPGGYYTLHNEFRFHDEWRIGGPRVISIFIVLSETEDVRVSGGSFGFPALDWLLVRPKKGSLLMWSNLNDDDLKPHIKVKHELMPVKEGDVYMFSTHIHQFSIR